MGSNEWCASNLKSQLPVVSKNTKELKTGTPGRFGL